MQQLNENVVNINNLFANNIKTKWKIIMRLIMNKRFTH